MMERPQNPPRGTRDLLPNESSLWRVFEAQATQILTLAGFGEIRLPLFEHTEVFARSAGETSDIVNKEMYTFQDRSERSLTLRPEGTAGVVRAYLCNGMDRWSKPVRLWYQGAMFRYERSQRGRYRQFHQIGAELFGSNSPESEAELIRISLQVLKQAGLSDLSLELNSVGDSPTKEAFQGVMRAFLLTHQAEICPDCQRRTDSNPIRALDCKVTADQILYASQAPKLSDHLSAASQDHFMKLQATLRSLDIPFKLSEQLVRGLDYYTGTVFEIKTASSLLSGQNTICAGGRYDALVEEFGGPATPAFGWALGVERVMTLLTSDSNEPISKPIGSSLIYGEFVQAALLAEKLRQKGFLSLLDYDLRAEKKAFEAAQKQKLNFYINLCPAQGGVSLKDLWKGESKNFASQDELIDYLCNL